MLLPKGSHGWWVLVHNSYCSSSSIDMGTKGCGCISWLEEQEGSFFMRINWIIYDLWKERVRSGAHTLDYVSRYKLR